MSLCRYSTYKILIKVRFYQNISRINIVIINFHSIMVGYNFERNNTYIIHIRSNVNSRILKLFVLQFFFKTSYLTDINIVNNVQHEFKFKCQLKGQEDSLHFHFSLKKYFLMIKFITNFSFWIIRDVVFKGMLKFRF